MLAFILGHWIVYIYVYACPLYFFHSLRQLENSLISPVDSRS